MSLYNLNFNYAALIIYAVVWLYYVGTRHVKNEQRSIFLSLCVVSFLTTLLDMLVAGVESNGFSRPVLVWTHTFY